MMARCMPPTVPSVPSMSSTVPSMPPTVPSMPQLGKFYYRKLTCLIIIIGTAGIPVVSKPVGICPVSQSEHNERSNEGSNGTTVNTNPNAVLSKSLYNSWIPRPRPIET